GAATLNCNDVYGNAYGNYFGTNGFSLDPLFCRADYDEFGLTEGSPCLPVNNGCGVLIGAMGEVECTPRAVIAVDRSGSMSISGPLGISRFDQAKELAVEELMRLLEPNDQDYPEIVETAIMYFNADGIVLHHDFSTDSTSLKEAILSIPTPRHDTPLAAAMCQSLCSMMDQGQGIKYMVTMTDGLENESQNFEICNLCRHCNQFFSSGWNYDCDPDEDPSSCTDWQLCLAETLESKGTHIVHYFGQTLEPQTKAGVGEGLEDMLFLEAAADNSSGSFYYHSDLATVCGDANYDGSVNVSDAVYIVNYVFIGGDEPVDHFASDSNCDGTVNISDAVYIINFIFISGPAPCANCQ
ncbi:MAG: VWA domain-containing protein, partial [candidate division Zixibacteria bacterium]|nr:VWA domain-containing protein [candidate division Zixibacteria bacterium]